MNRRQTYKGLSTARPAFFTGRHGKIPGPSTGMHHFFIKNGKKTVPEIVKKSNIVQNLFYVKANYCSTRSTEQPAS